MGKKGRKKRESKRDGLSLFRSNDTHAQRAASIERPFAQVSVPVILVSLFLILATLVVYWQIRNHDFVNYDDDTYVTENRHVQAGLSWEGTVWAFATFHAANWHPVTWLSHMFDCQIYGLNAGGHHLTNLLIHLVNTLLLFAVLRRMTGAFWRSAFVAALFALHPLHVESVAWVAERKDVLSTLFWFATMWAYVRHVQNPALTRYLLVVVLFALGLMAKPMLVTFPFVLLLIDYWPLRRFQTGNREPQPETEKSIGRSYQMSVLPHLIREKVPLFALAAVSCTVTLLAQKAGGAVRSLDMIPFHIRLANALVAYISYIGKMLWPLNLAVFYLHPGMRPMWQPAGATLLLLCVCFLVIRTTRRFPYFAVGWLWYLGTLVPVIGIVQVGSQSLADRYTYVPLIGLFIIIAWGAAELVPRWRYRRLLLATSAGVVLLALTVCAWSQVRYWSNSVVLFKHTVGVTTDNYLAHYNLANALAKQGDLEEAISHYSEVLKIKPDHAWAHNNLGIALSKQGELDEAIHHYSEALRINDNLADAHNNLGIALSKQGKLEEAISQYSRTLKINPDHVHAHTNLGVALNEQGKIEEAIRQYSKALEINPRYARAHNNMGNALAAQGRLHEAISHYSKALEINPRYASAHNNLGLALYKQGKLQDAIDHYSEALRISPGYTIARRNLNHALKQAGNHENGPNTVTNPGTVSP